MNTLKFNPIRGYAELWHFFLRVSPGAIHIKPRWGYTENNVTR